MSESEDRRPLPSLDVHQIMRLLPHRAPMLMIDRIVDIVEGQSATGIKCVTFNEPFFVGHFPGRPIMPGVLIVEALAQTAGAVVMHSLGTTADGKTVLFMTIDRARFRRPVTPGDMLQLKVKLQRARGPVFRFEGQALVDGALCAEAEFSAMIAADDSSATQANA